MEPVILDNSHNLAVVTPQAGTLKSKSETAICQKICKLVRKIFKALKNLILFPVRYIGGKDFSLSGVVIRAPICAASKVFSENHGPERALFGAGYHRSLEKTLTRDESLQFVKYAGVAGAQHTLDESWIKPLNLELYNVRQANFDLSSLPGNIQINDKCFYDQTTGLKATISVSDNEVIVGFGALGAFRHLYNDLPDAEKKLNTDKMEKIQNNSIYKNMAGFKPKHYKQADALFQLIKNHPDFQNKHISLAGQCYGGSIAEYIGIKNQVSAVCFNTLAMGAGLQDAIGDKLLSHADKYVTHISVDTDFVSDNRIVPVFDRTLSLLGVRTPGNFGRRYAIPTAYTKKQETHDYMIGSLLVHLGHTNRDKFTVLDAADMAVAQEALPENFEVTI